MSCSPRPLQKSQQRPLRSLLSYNHHYTPANLHTCSYSEEPDCIGRSKQQQRKDNQVLHVWDVSRDHAKPPIWVPGATADERRSDSGPSSWPPWPTLLSWVLSLTSVWQNTRASCPPSSAETGKSSAWLCVPSPNWSKHPERSQAVSMDVKLSPLESVPCCHYSEEPMNATTYPTIQISICIQRLWSHFIAFGFCASPKCIFTILLHNRREL